MRLLFPTIFLAPVLRCVCFVAKTGDGSRFSAFMLQNVHI